MEMAPPDGFTTTATTHKPVYKPVVPQFSSAFNRDCASDLTSTGTFLPALHGSLMSNQLKIDVPILRLRPPPKPPILPSYHTPITSALLKPAVPPPLLANKQPSKDLKSLQPPIIHPPSNSAIDGKSLRTILNTRVALATDLSALEKDYVIHTSFVRGGLAARASTFFEQSQISLVLWQKETERRANTLSSSDLRVNIIKILKKPIPAGSKLISPGIALCRMRETNDATSHHKSYNIDDLYRIAFSFPSCLTKSIFNDPLQFSEGRTVRICCPWQEIELSLPANLPLPSSEPTLTPDVTVNNKTLLCSRFFIL
jgi:hypothetical protein